jgi:hypothetical protein
MPSPLAQKTCVPCRGDTPPLDPAERERLHKELGGGWEIEHGHHLSKQYKFKNFVSDKQPFNFSGTMTEDLVNADALEIVLSVTDEEIIGVRVFPFGSADEASDIV